MLRDCIFRVKSRFLSKEFANYFMIGCVVFFFDALVFWWVLSAFSFDAGIANFVSRFSAALLGFALHFSFTFSRSTHKLKSSFLRFWIWWFGVTAIGSALLKFFDGVIGVDLWLALIKVVIEGGVVGMTFLVYKFWVYR